MARPREEREGQKEMKDVKTRIGGLIGELCLAEHNLFRLMEKTAHVNDYAQACHFQILSIKKSLRECVEELESPRRKKKARK